MTADRRAASRAGLHMPGTTPLPSDHTLTLYSFSLGAWQQRRQWDLRTSPSGMLSHWSKWLKSTNNKCWRFGENRTLLHCWGECKLAQPLWRTVWRFLKKTKLELPYDPATPLLGMYPEKIIIQKDTCIPVFTAALFTIAKTWKQPECPSTDEWMKKVPCIQTEWNITHSWKRVSQKEKDKYHISLVQSHVEYKIQHTRTYLWTETDSQLGVARWVVGDGLGVQAEQIQTHI